MLDKLTSADFTPHLNQKFHIHLESSASLEVELIEVSPLGAAPQAGETPERRRHFSLIFRAADETYLPQKIYRLENAEMGTLDLFLVPVGPDKHGMRFEAVFT